MRNLQEVENLLEDMEADYEVMEEERNLLIEIFDLDGADELTDDLDNLTYDMDELADEIQAINTAEREGNSSSLESVGMSQSDFI